MSSLVPFPALLPQTTARCRVSFGRQGAGLERCPRGTSLGIALPVLAGRSDEELLGAAAGPQLVHGCSVYRRGSRLAGYVAAAAEAELEDATRDLYRRMFAATSGLQLYRVWNYVPTINAVVDGLEQYRRFCRGRSLAFEEHFGAGFEPKLPAASAVGTQRGPLAIAFVAGPEVPRHFENPWQVPAFSYPPVYGPRPPSFSRATRIGSPGREEIYVSGTAAIRGHASVAVDDLRGQLRCTGENLEMVAEVAGAGKRFGRDAGWTRSFKVYVRRDTDLSFIRQDLESQLLTPADNVSYLQADLCRIELLVEIEAVLTRPTFETQPKTAA